MKALKYIGITIVVILVLFLGIIPLFLASKVHVERSLEMKAAPQVVFSQINNLKNWEKWSPWYKLDPNAKYTYSGPEEGVGSGHSWESENSNVGKGKQTITESKPNELIVMELDFAEQGKSYPTFKLEPAGTGTKVTWFMDMDMGGNPIGKWFGLAMDKMLGPMFESGLTNLSALTETIPAEPAMDFKIEEATIEAQKVVLVNVTCTAQEIGQKLGESYGKLQEAIKKAGAEMAGPPFAIYNSFSMEKVEMQPGMSVTKEVKASGDIIASEIKAGNVVFVDHYGPYEQTEKVHNAIQAWCKEHNKQIIGAPWEVYVTDPQVEKDPSKLLTKVYYPVQ